MHFQLHTLRLQYSIERICAAIRDNRTLRCPLYCKLGGKYSTHPPVFAMWTVIPVIYNAFTAPHIQTSVFIWTYLRWYCRYLENATRDIRQTWSQMQRTSSSLRFMNCGPGHVQWTYSCTYSGNNIQLNLTTQLLEICRHLDARYAATLVRYIAHTLQFTLCELWSRPYTMYLQLHIFRLQYSSERIVVAIGDIWTTQCMLYYKLGDKYSAHPPVFAMWTVIPDIYNVFTAPHIQTSIFNWTYICAAIRDISRILCALYCKLGANTAHSLQFTQCELWPRYTLQIQFRIFSLQYSTERISAAIGDMSRIQCALYCKLCAKFSAHPADYTIWMVVPPIYWVITAPHIQASIFNWT
jgi:hypothetical protein